MANELNLEKAVDDAIRKTLDGDDRREVVLRGTGNADELKAEAGVRSGGWGISAFFKRLRKQRANEGGFEITKEL